MSLDHYQQGIAESQEGGWWHCCVVRQVVPNAILLIALFMGNIYGKKNMLLDFEWVLKERKMCL